MGVSVTYYGVRGSIPVSGKAYKHYGGNTTCVMLQQGDVTIIIDAGTGIRQLGNDLMATRDISSKNKFNILFSHTHWDHIQGFPFFTPAYLPTSTLEIYGETKTIRNPKKNTRSSDEIWDIKRVLSNQQIYTYFPVPLNVMASEKKYHDLAKKPEFMIDAIKIRTLRMHHPNDTIGFRFEFNGGSFCFCTDVEHNDEMVKRLIEFAHGADVFAYDSQYYQKEYESGKKGWGHSTYNAGSKIAHEAEVKEYHLIHHDPSHEDSTIQSMEADCKRLFKNSFAVHEGHKITF